jgi:signal transduction histidine kinase
MPRVLPRHLPGTRTLGRARERLFMGSALAGRVNELADANAQLAADLNASMVDLEASRRRLVEAADVERRRIERDLHDGAQQHLLGMRLRLELAAEAIREDPTRGERMLEEIGEQMDETLKELRGLAQGVYPPLLPEHGLGEAIRSAARCSPFPGSVEARGIGRYPADTETAVYFCCLEALQNVAKHAGPQVGGMVRLWEEGQRLCFEVRDEGSGFAVGSVQPGSGLVNMRDRMEASGGELVVSSCAGQGTVVRGSVPLAQASIGGARDRGRVADQRFFNSQPTQERSHI